MTNEDRERLLKYRRRFKARGIDKRRQDRRNPDPRVKKGDRFGKLEVTLPNYLNITMCMARCECGHEGAYRAQDLLDGRKSHCGCSRSYRRGAALGEGRAAPE